MQHGWAEIQARFVAALRDDGVPPPVGVTECGYSSKRAGFSVYRNNSSGSLIAALQERFPVIHRLVGDEFFRFMARSFISAKPPRSPLLMLYGDELPAFLESFAPALDVHYLADVARLEVAWSEAYHAAERQSLQPRSLAGVAPGMLLEMALSLHPSIRLLRSRFPVADIWFAHQGSDVVQPPEAWRAQDVMIVRPEAEVHVYVLRPGMYSFLAALLEGKCLQPAAEAALAGEAVFDVGEGFMFLLLAGAIAALVSPPQEIIR